MDRSSDNGPLLGRSQKVLLNS